MKIGDKKWIEKADEAAKKNLCSYCGNAPIHRPFPGGLGICKICDDKLDIIKNKKEKKNEKN